ncbi:MAG: hypothetical protein ABIL06_18480, partial [Pseudomonadota bacterium]
FGWGGVIGVIVAMLIMVAFQLGFVGYLFTACSALERWMAVASAGFMLVSMFRQSNLLLVVGLCLVAVVVFSQSLKRRSADVAGP